MTAIAAQRAKPLPAISFPVRVNIALLRLDDLGAGPFARKLAKRHGVKIAEVLGSSRHPRITRARHELWSVVRDTFGLSYPELARVFCTHHTTIVTAVNNRRTKIGIGEVTAA